MNTEYLFSGNFYNIHGKYLATKYFLLSNQLMYKTKYVGCNKSATFPQPMKQVTDSDH